MTCLGQNETKTSILQSELDFQINAGRKFQALKRFHRFVGRSEHIDQPFVSSRLKLFPAVLVLVDRTDDGYDFFLGRKWNRAGNSGAGAFCGLHNF